MAIFSFLLILNYCLNFIKLLNITNGILKFVIFIFGLNFQLRHYSSNDFILLLLLT